MSNKDQERRSLDIKIIKVNVEEEEETQEYCDDIQEITALVDELAKSLMRQYDALKLEYSVKVASLLGASDSDDIVISANGHPVDIYKCRQLIIDCALKDLRSRIAQQKAL